MGTQNEPKKKKKRVRLTKFGKRKDQIFVFLMGHPEFELEKAKIFTSQRSFDIYVGTTRLWFIYGLEVYDRIL